MLTLTKTVAKPAPDISISKNTSLAWLWLSLVVFLIGIYFVVRFNGHWAENDSAVFTSINTTFINEGKLEPSSGEAYPHGYGFQSISAALTLITGVDVTTFQQIVYPLLAFLVVIPAWVMFRELIGNTKGATIATVILFIQPEFLFVILRSSHEKFTRTMMILCLFALVRSFKMRDNLANVAVYVFLFYLSAFALISSNNLLGNSFIVALAVALLLGFMGSMWKKNLRLSNTIILRRFSYAVVICLGLVFVFTFYFYTPAKEDFLLLKSVGNKIASLFLDVQTKPSNAVYTYVSAAWVSPVIYYLVSIANWVTLAGSALIWVVQGFRWIILGKSPSRDWDWIIWILYSAYAIQGALSTVVDSSGAFDNLQYRTFPSFVILAIALISTYLARFNPTRFRRTLQAVMAILVFFVSILSVLKATNEPLVSNKWTFYHPSEINLMAWSLKYQPNRQIWTDFDERLNTAYITEKNSSNIPLFLAFDYLPSTRNIMSTSITRLRAIRQQRPLPIPPDAMQIYDNGEAQSYHLRPLTPYQR